MMRKHYRNGDTITLVHNGCDGCDICSINGLLCHEIGCPDAWRDNDDDPRNDPDAWRDEPEQEDEE